LLKEFYQKIHALTGNSALLSLVELADFSSAFEAFLLELQKKPENVNPSTTRTLVQAVELINILLDRARSRARKDRKSFTALVVDDDVVACKMMTYSLQRARIVPTVLTDPLDAWESAQQRNYDLFILDVNMPGMNGFELCKKIRSLPGSQKTPVLFITSQTDFESRTKSTLSGGNELVSKPFLLMELTVKSLLYILR